MKQTSISKIIGIFEPVRFPDFPQVGMVQAKVDTGAYSGSLHCTTIKEKLIKGEKVLEFSPFDHPEVIATAKNFSVREVRSSNGRQLRYFINTKINIKGHDYPIRMSLADRSQMKRPMLIGRRFLKKHNFLVDVSLMNR